jgi:Enoyl-CoA hydratase/carnithine racemase
VSQFQSLNYQVHNRVASITLSSPDALNAIHRQMRLELMQAFALAEADDDVRLVIIKGAGRGFCAGADLSEGMPDFDSFVQQCEVEWKPWLMQIRDSSKLYIAAVHGACAGIAVALALNCDFVLMAEDAYLYQAFAAIGLIPDGGVSSLLLQKLGYHRALDMIVNAKKIDAQQCLEFGLANQVVANDQLFDVAQSLAEEMALGAPLAQAAAKRVLRQAQTLSYSDVVDLEAREQDKLIVTQDSRDAFKAFFNKQKPQFNGR